jgi:hypothetical protein
MADQFDAVTDHGVSADKAERPYGSAFADLGTGLDNGRGMN